jgi:hypothetical protein
MRRAGLRIFPPSSRTFTDKSVFQTTDLKGQTLRGGLARAGGPGNELSGAAGFSDGPGEAPEPEGLRIGRYGHGFYRCLDLVPRFWAGIGAALVGLRYWLLVALSITSPLVATIGFWVAAGWIPGMPRRRVGIRSMIRFGGTLTLNGVIAYAAYNAEKVMIGRFWDAGTIGLYGRAYQLISIPTDNLNLAVGEVAFSALSRLQHDPARLRRYFLKGLSLVLGLTLPITFACAVRSLPMTWCSSSWEQNGQMPPQLFAYWLRRSRFFRSSIH